MSVKKVKKLKKKDSKKRKSKTWGWQLSAALIFNLVLIAALLWALFIAGPVRVRENTTASRYAVIKEQVPEIQGLEETVFDYVTYQGYTLDTLYWFDVTGQIITTRGMETLDYNKARTEALETYNVQAEVVQLAFGYSAPVYEIIGSGKYLLLDYDTLARVYERQTSV